MVKEARDRSLAEKFLAAVRNPRGVSLVEEMIAKGAEVNAALDGVTPLMQAALRNNAEVAAWLLAWGGAEADIADATGRTPLYVAVEKKFMSVITALAKHGADPDLPGPGGQTPRAHAAAEGNKDILDAIDTAIQDGARERITNCIVDHQLEALEEQLARGILKDFEKTPPQTATPVMLAIVNNFPEALEALLKAGAKAETVTAGGYTPLGYAVRECAKNPQFTRLLLKYGAKPDTPTDGKDYPLLLAVDGGAKEIVELLLAARADTEVRNGEGETATYRAAAAGLAEMIPLLAGAGAQLDARSGHGDTPLGVAITAGQRGSFDALLSCGADPKATAENGATTVMKAARSGETEMLAVLLNLGVDADARRTDGWTALHIAAMRGMKDAAALLLGAGAEYSLPTLQGQTALHIAHEFRRDDIISLINDKTSADLGAGLRAPQPVGKPLRFVMPGVKSG